MATLGVEHARRKHAAQLATVFGDLLLAISSLRCILAFDAPKNAAAMETFMDHTTEGLKTQLHGFYMQASSFSQPPN